MFLGFFDPSLGAQIAYGALDAKKAAEESFTKTIKTIGIVGAGLLILGAAYLIFRRL